MDGLVEDTTWHCSLVLLWHFVALLAIMHVCIAGEDGYMDRIVVRSFLRLCTLVGWDLSSSLIIRWSRRGGGGGVWYVEDDLGIIHAFASRLSCAYLNRGCPSEVLVERSPCK